MKNLRKKLAVLLLLSVLTTFSPSLPVFAEDSADVDEGTVRNAYLILLLENQLSQKQSEYNKIQDQIESAQDELLTVRESIDSLEEQIADIDASIDESESKIESVTAQIGTIQVDLPEIMEDIEMRELQLEDQKGVAGDLMQVLYVKKNIYYDSSDNLSAVKLILAEGSVSDVTQDMVYLNIFEEASKDIFIALEKSKRDLEDKKTELEEKNLLLSKLESDLWAENEELVVEKQGKETLLDETQGKEDIYKDLLIESKQQQDEVQDEMDILYANLDLIQGKFDASTQNLTQEQIDEIMNIKADALLQNGVQGSSDFLQLDWPVDPSGKGLSAYFDDPGYVSAFGVAHHAIDIPVMQGTAIEAPADGVVYKISYDPKSIGYAYIMLAHRKGVVTVYGHVSAVAVAKGDYVERGQIIGLTGGVPGTIGAGLRTTGAHLHFEVWQDGVLVDPLNYLDLTAIPIDTLREDYLKKLQEEIEAQIDSIEATLESLNR